jgi:hypothetical protein
MTTDSHYRFYQGPWVDGTSAVFLIIAWQQDVPTQATRIETYILIPGLGRLIEWPATINLQTGMDPEAEVSTLLVLAKDRIQSRLTEKIPVRSRVQYPNLSPCALTEIGRDTITADLMTYHQSASQRIRSCLDEIRDQTSCEAPQNCLKTLRELFPRNP